MEYSTKHKGNTQGRIINTFEGTRKGDKGQGPFWKLLRISIEVNKKQGNK